MYSVSYYSELSPQMATIMGIISLALAVLSYVAMWRVFEKADRPGWAALIPFIMLIRSLILYTVTDGSFCAVADSVL